MGTYRKLRKINTDIHIYEFDPKVERLEPSYGIKGKLEPLSKIGSPEHGEEVACKINAQFFNGKSTEFYGAFEIDGVKIQGPSATFLTVSFTKDFKLVLGESDNDFWAIGTSFTLVINGKKDIRNTEPFKDILGNNPRSAIGQKVDDTIVLVVVQGRKKNKEGLTNEGATADELVDIMLEAGCIFAVNMDGGGSSEMIVNDEIVNQPSDGRERAIGTAFIVYKKKGVVSGMYIPQIKNSAYISPSTQEANIGQGGYGSEERVMNLIADITIPILEHNGITCYRNKPTMTHITSMQDSNKKMPGIHLAIHSNATGAAKNANIRGCKVFYCNGSINGKKLAGAVYNRVSMLTPVSDKGIEPADLTEVVKTLAPAALIEIDFHDNPEGAAWILANIVNIGTAIALGVCDYFGIKVTLPTEQEDAEKPGGNELKIAVFLQAMGYKVEWNPDKGVLVEDKLIDTSAFITYEGYNYGTPDEIRAALEKAGIPFVNYDKFTELNRKYAEVRAGLQDLMSKVD